MSRPASPNRVYIALGSNIEPAENLPAAVRLLGEYGTVTAASTVYETLPILFHEQANFLNAVVRLETDQGVEAIFNRVVPEVEETLRRVRDPANRNGPRTIDLDVALFNDWVVRIAGHDLPDPDIETRPFVGIPLAEIAPKQIHPVTRRTLAEMAESFRVEMKEMRPRPDVVLLPGG